MSIDKRHNSSTDLPFSHDDMALFPLPPLRLLASAGYLSLRAQAVKNRDLLTVWETIKTSAAPSGPYLPDEVLRSVLIASAMTRRLGMEGSCLVRSLVAGRLLLGQKGLLLHIGMHTDRNETSSPTGHAWIALSGRNLSDPPEQGLPQGLIITRTIELTLEDK